MNYQDRSVVSGIREKGVAALQIRNTESYSTMAPPANRCFQCQSVLWHPWAKWECEGLPGCFYVGRLGPSYDRGGVGSQYSSSKWFSCRAPFRPSYHAGECVNTRQAAGKQRLQYGQGLTREIRFQSSFPASCRFPRVTFPLASVGCKHTDGSGRVYEYTVHQRQHRVVDKVLSWR